MKAVTALQMKQIENNSLNYGQSYKNLMRNAGNAAAEIIASKQNLLGRNIAVVCGKGNNGGDGFVVADNFKKSGANVTAYLTDGEPKSEEAKEMLILAKQNGVNVAECLQDTLFENYDIIIDALFGTGFKGNLNEKHTAICKNINRSSAIKFSLDIPSGICTDNEFYDSNCVKPNFTITFDSYKVCHVLAATAELCGEVIIADIGIPAEAHKNIEYNFELIDNSFVFNNIKTREKNSHKGNNGKLLNISGSRQYTGAAVLSSSAAARCGVGYVAVASTEYVCSIVSSYMPEVIYLTQKENKYGGIEFLKEDLTHNVINSYSTILLGCGLGNNEITADLVNRILDNYTGNLIIDADGINIISKNIDIIKNRKANLILTPHLGEMSRLTGKNIDEIKNDRINISTEFSKMYNCVLVLKGPNTLVTSPTGKCYVNITGNAGLAKAGSGDILSGMISSFAAQGLPLECAAACGVYLHGAAADLTAKRLSQYSMQPSDILTDLSTIFLANGR